MSARCIFIIGGSRSGKSAFAQNLARESAGKVVFVATAESGDPEMAHRIAAHRKNRTKDWHTLEITRGLGHQIEKGAGDARTVVIDCLTLLISNLIVPAAGAEDKINSRTAARSVKKELNDLLKCLDSVDATFIIVSNEVGMGLVPPYPLGRVYRDLLGEVNQAIAGRADEVYFMCAGIPMRVK